MLTLDYRKSLHGTNHQLEEVRDQRIRREMRHRCSVSCVLPAGHEGLHMRQDGTRISEEKWPAQDPARPGHCNAPQGRMTRSITLNEAVMLHRPHVEPALFGDEQVGA